MVLSKNYHARLNSLKSAVEDLERALSQDLSQFSPDLQDLIQNGQIQKFEFCIELLWKVIKIYLFEKSGVDELAPKAILKAFFRTEEFPYIDYERLINMIDDRNILSHVYSKMEFMEIYNRLRGHILAIRHTLDYLSKLSEK